MHRPTPRARGLSLLLALTLVGACTDKPSPVAPDIDIPEPQATVLSGADVLILASSVSGGAGSREAQAVAALGYTFDLATNAEWASLTTAQFASYKAIILGDPTCQGFGSAARATAQANANVWGPAVNGNVVVIGTDPTFHSYLGGALALIKKGVAFALDSPLGTGAYITTSCYYHGVGANTPVPMLDGLSTLGNFTARGVGCYNNAYITASHPALDGLTNANLSGWSCSIHNGFDSWPADFEVLAIGRGIGAYFTAPDGTQGVPYILARGEGLIVISDISLAPLSATGVVGTTHTVTATVLVDESPAVGVLVTFTVVDGPHAGTSFVAPTDPAGQASFTYAGATAGVDGIRAQFVDPLGVTQTSTRVTMEWTEPVNEPPTADAGADQSATRTSPAGVDVTLDGSGSSDPDGTIVSYAWSSDTGHSASGATPTLTLPLGVHTFTLTVTDDFGATDTDEVVITVLNAAPTAAAGADVTAECTDCSVGSTSVSLDGSGSSDVDGTIASYEWSIGGSVVATGATPTVALSLGTHTVTLTVTDNDGATDSDEMTVTVEDTTAPAISFALSVTEIWPPNHKMVTVATGITVTDACDSGVALGAGSFSVTSNEPINATGDGNTDPDWLVVDNGDGTWSLQVRAERDGAGTGRIYTISVTATDGSGNTSTATGQVKVPHSQSKGNGQ